MKCVKYLSLASVWFAGHIAAQTCRVELNEYNRYPFVVRIIFNGQMRAHGSLVAPYRVLSAHDALPDVYPRRVLWPKLEFTMHVYDKVGALRCTISRKLKEITAPADKRYSNMAFFALESGFPTTDNQPFVFNRLEDVNEKAVLRAMNETQDKETCILPMFDSRNPENTKLNWNRISYLRGNVNDQIRWRDLACKDDPEHCNKPYFFAFDPINRWPDYAWYKGAVMICRGMPIGMFSKVVKGPSRNEMITVFESIAYITPHLYPWCQKEWPKPLTTTTTVNYSRKPTEYAKTSRTFTTVVHNSMSTTGGTSPPFSNLSTVNTRGSTFPTRVSSLIPLAPRMSIGLTTLKTTPMFIRTRPRHARLLNANVRTTSPIHVTLLTCSAHLILIHAALNR